MKYIDVIDAKYIEGYKVEIFFNDKTSKIVDFEPFLVRYPHPQYDKYKDLKKFKKFKIDHGNIVWGKDWDLIFPVHKLYKGYIC